MSRRLKLRGPFLAWAFWSGAVLACYYRQLGGIFFLGLAGWIRDTPSFGAALVSARALAGGLPFWASALLRAFEGVWAAGLILLAAQIIGAGVFKIIRWEPAAALERLLFRTAIGLGGLSYLGFGLAQLGWYRPGPLQVLVLLILSAGGFALLRKKQFQKRLSRFWIQLKGPRPKGEARGEQLRHLPHTQGIQKPPPLTRVWLAISVCAVGLAFIGALAPEKEYDALWYHLELPKLWLAQGHPVDLVAEYVSLYPLTWELLYGLGLALSGQIAAKLLHFTCLVLGGLLVYQWVQVRYHHRSPWLAVALFVTVPTVFWEATTGYNDLALAYFSGLAIYALLRFTDRLERPWLYLAALSMGLALATKHLSLIWLAIALPGLAAWLWREGVAWKRIISLLVVFGGISLLLPLPWYLRSWIASGNPVFPDLYGVFGAFPPERWSAITQRGFEQFKNHFGDGRGLLSLLALPWNMTIHASRYGGSLGPLFLAVLPALLIKPGERETRWLAAGAGAYLALWASPLSSFQIRFLVPVTPLLAVLASQALLRASQDLSWSHRRLAGLLLAGLLLLNLPPFLSVHEGDRVGDQGWLTHVVHDLPWGVVLGAESQDRYLARTVDSYRAWQYINTHLPSQAMVLTFSGGDHFYSERPRVWSDATAAYPAVWGSPLEKTPQALAALRRLGVGYVLVDARLLHSPPPQAPALTYKSVLACWFAVEYQDDRYDLYRLLDENETLCS